MFNFKSQILGAAALLPVVAAGLLGSAGSAQAGIVGVESGFNYSDSQGTTSTGITATIGKINNGLIDFQSPSVANLSNQYGYFENFNGAKLYDIDYNPLTPIPSLFMDLSANFPTQTPNGPETPDGANIFSLTKFDNGPTITYTSTGATLLFNFEGIFDQDGVTGGSDAFTLLGNIVFNAGFSRNGITSGTTSAKRTALLNKFNSNTGILTSFTGLTVGTAPMSVPEPTTMLGLGLVAAGMTVARRKLVKA